MQSRLGNRWTTVCTSARRIFPTAQSPTLCVCVCVCMRISFLSSLFCTFSVNTWLISFPAKLPPTYDVLPSCHGHIDILFLGGGGLSLDKVFRHVRDWRWSLRLFWLRRNTRETCTDSNSSPRDLSFRLILASLFIFLCQLCNSFISLREDIRVKDKT